MNELILKQDQLENMLSWVIILTQNTGKMLADYPKNNLNTYHKGDIDLVTNADLESEQILTSAIRKQYPDHAIISEEMGKDAKLNPYCWIIDPLDGTTNYSRGLPFYGISIALCYENKVLLGVVYAPELHLLFHAIRGNGAFQNNCRIQVSNTRSLASSFLVTGFPYTMRQSENDNIALFRQFSKLSLAVRRLGSAALDLCFIAKGTFDGYWELLLHPWDYAAGMLIVEEAGGKVSTMHKQELPLDQASSVLASNRHMHEDLLNIIALQP